MNKNSNKIEPGKQVISLYQVIQLIAQAQAKKEIARLPLKQFRKDLDELEREKAEKNLKHLKEYIDDERFLCFQFLFPYAKVVVDNPLIVYVDSINEHGYNTKIECVSTYNKSIVDIIKGLSQAQRKCCYIVRDGKIQNFMVVGEEVVLEEMLGIGDNQINTKSINVKERVSKAKLKEDILKIIASMKEEFDNNIEILERALKEL